MSKIRIITDDEVFTFKYGDSSFQYRRATSDEISLLKKKYTDSQFVIDNESFGDEALEKFILGWNGIVDGNGKELPFNVKHLKVFPNPVKTALLGALNGERLDDDLVGEELEKKSSPTQKP